MIFAYINWDIDPVMVTLGPLEIRYYSVLFAIAFWLGYVIMSRMMRIEKCPEEWCDKIFIYTILATIIGSRLGHVIFYGWDFYSKHPIEIFKVWEGGLSSHGGAIGILIALYIYHKKVSKRSYLWVMDHIVIPTALAGFFIRTGNLFNSEIVGAPTDLPWAFRFLRIHPDMAIIPRHPSQIYEATFYLCVFITLWYLYTKKNLIRREGAIFGIFLICVFGFRILIENIKADQEPWEADMVLNMGQILSIPFVLLGIFCLVRSMRRAPKDWGPAPGYVEKVAENKKK